MVAKHRVATVRLLYGQESVNLREVSWFYTTSLHVSMTHRLQPMLANATNQP
jgi:hypothetical protein